MSSNIPCIAHGSPNLRTTSSVVNYKIDGYIDGETVHEGNDSLIASVPVIGNNHPDEGNANCFDRTITRTQDGKFRAVCKYVGISGTKTDPIAVWSGGSGQAPIDSHPRFKEFAGDPLITDSNATGYCAPLIINGSESGYLEGQNGAIFDAYTKQFVKFAAPTNIKAGVRTYFKSGDQVSVSYYTRSVPSFADRNKVFTSFPVAGIDVNPTVKSWLLIDMPVQQIGVGSIAIYKVTELYLGSDDVEGWDADIYDAGLTRST